MEKIELLPKVGQMGRRKLLSVMATTGIVAMAPSCRSTSRESHLEAPKGKPWKLDVAIYDRPGWTSTTYGLPVIKRDNNQLVIGFQAQREDAIGDDFYSAHAEWIFLSSDNGGKSGLALVIPSPDQLIITPFVGWGGDDNVGTVDFENFSVKCQ